jgi:hypothetical protein
MRKFILLFSFFTLFFSFSVFSQKRYTLSGYIRDAKTGENLIGATIYIREKPGTGAVSNAYGFYSITLPAGQYHTSSLYVGYIAQEQTIDLTQSVKIDFVLNPRSKDLNEVVVTGIGRNENVTQTQMGLQKLDMKEINNIPVLFGERDVLKTIQLLPGIKSAGEGSSGFNVRGGATDQNLILLDEATVYNASHLLGFFSVFNSDAIKDVSIYKGNEPAEYGGRLASVLDIKMNDGNNQKFGVSGGIGLIASRINIEGPIVKNKGSFVISARRTYADLFLKLSNDTSVRGTKLYFYDLNAKANYKINDKNRIYLSGYFGKDVFGYQDLFGLNWGNSTATLRWNHLVSDQLFSNTSLIFSDYNYKINVNFSAGNEINIISRIQDYGLKQDFQFYKSENSTWKYGISSVYHQIIPGEITAGENFTVSSLTNKHAWENALYFSDQHQLSSNLSMECGLRLSTFSLFGPGTFYHFDTNGNTTDSTNYQTGKIMKSYLNIEPRVTFNYLINKSSSIKVSYARNTQNLHLLSNSTSGSPTDLWIPNSNNVKPEIADQISLGYYRNFADDMFEFSIESYYKNLQNQIDYKDGAELNYTDDVESQILFGKGRAYGLELFLKKKYGKVNGWISYTLSRTERKFDEINNGDYYPARQDRTHDISVVGIYKVNERWSFSSTWVYNTGNAVTFPCGKYEVAGQTRYYYTDRNASRMPAYHRLDLGANLTVSEHSSWSFSLYNAYGHKNAYMIYFKDGESDPTKTEATRITLFQYIPSVTYNFKF